MSAYLLTLDQTEDLKEMISDKSPKSLTIMGSSILLSELTDMNRGLVAKITQKIDLMRSDVSSLSKSKIKKDFLFAKESKPNLKVWTSSENTERLENLFRKISTVQNIKEINFRGMDLESLPMFCENLEGVEKISFSDGTLGQFQCEIKSTNNLRIFEMKRSFLREFPIHFKNFPKLEHFILNIGGVPFDLLMDTYGLTIHLSILSLPFLLEMVSSPWYKDDNVTPEEKRKLISRAAYRKLKSLLSDGIAGELRGLRKFYSSLQFRKLPKDVEFNRKMKNLTITNTHCKKIPVSLFLNNHIRRMNFSANQFLHLPEVSQENHHLQYLDVSSERMMLNDNLVLFIRKFSKLRSLRLENGFEKGDLIKDLGGTRFVALISGKYEETKTIFLNGLKKIRNQKRVRRFLQNDN
jgi:hypothetical protein